MAPIDSRKHNRTGHRRQWPCGLGSDPEHPAYLARLVLGRRFPPSPRPDRRLVSERVDKPGR